MDNTIYKNYCKKYIPVKQFSDSMGRSYLSREDIDVCNYVIDQLSYVDFEFIPGKEINLDEMINKGIEDIKVFGNDISERVVGLLRTIPITQVYDDEFMFSAQVDNNIKPNDKIKSWEYLIPTSLYEHSIYLFNHEHLHVLKESNFNEWKDSTVLGEVIPMFYELISLDSNDLVKKEFIKFRLNDLYKNKEEYLIATELVENEKDFKNRELYEYVRTMIGRYLNGIYYAIILYRMYLENSKKTLDLISKVLRQEMTTKDMLIMLNIYRDIRGELFEKELGKIRKNIK